MKFNIFQRDMLGWPRGLFYLELGGFLLLSALVCTEILYGGIFKEVWPAPLPTSKQDLE